MNKINLLVPRAHLNGNQKGGLVSSTILPAFASILIGLIGWYFILQFQISEGKILESRLLEERLEIDRMEALVDKNQEELQELREKYTSLKQIRQNRSAQIKVFDIVTNSLPSGLSLSLSRMSLSDKTLQLSGTSIHSDAVNSFLSKLRSSDLLESVEMTSWQKSQRGFRFEILGHRKE